MMFYQVYKLLYTDLEKYFLGRGDELLAEILATGLNDVIPSDFTNAPVESRVRHLDNYAKDLKARPVTELRENFQLVLKAMRGLSGKYDDGVEFRHEFLEKVGSRGVSPISSENVDAIDSVSNLCWSLRS